MTLNVATSGYLVNFQPFTVYACVALMYFALCFPISAWSRSLESRLARGR